MNVWKSSRLRKILTNVVHMQTYSTQKSTFSCRKMYDYCHSFILVKPQVTGENNTIKNDYQQNFSHERFQRTKI